MVIYFRVIDSISLDVLNLALTNASLMLVFPLKYTAMHLKLEKEFISFLPKAAEGRPQCQEVENRT